MGGLGLGGVSDAPGELEEPLAAEPLTRQDEAGSPKAAEAAGGHADSYAPAPPPAASSSAP